jgi:beta-lactamase regulating signal transducer with metallopeptidase domain
VETLLHAALSNAVVVVLLAPVISLFGRLSRRPALVHSLWLIVFLKLLAPPLWPIPFSWPARSEDAPAATELAIHEQSLRMHSVETPSHLVQPDNGTGDAAEESAVPAAQTQALEDPVPTPRRAVLAAEPSPAPAAPGPPAAAAPFLISWHFLLLTVWLSGSALWLTMACYRLYRFHRLLRLTQPAPAILQSRAHCLAKQLGLARCPGVWVVPARISPMLWALLGEPRLLVPASLLDRLTEEQWDTLLAHELAHLRRRDHWVRLLEVAVIGLYWWHPVLWWARHKLREAEEQCCDAWVVWALPGAAEVYARALVEAVTYLSGARTVLPLAASGIGQMHLLKRRLTMIMRGTTPRALSATGSLAVFGLAALLLPVYPTLARTQGPDRPEDQQPGARAGVTRTTETPVAGATAAPQDFFRGGGVSYSGREQNYSETAEDAQDDVDLLRVQLDLRRAERREVEARLRQAQVDLQRYQRLAGNGGVSSDTVEHAKTEVVVQEARLSAKDAQIKEAQLRLKQAERRLARHRSRIAPPAKSSTASPERPTGSAIPLSQPRGGSSGGSGFAGGTSFTGGQFPTVFAGGLGGGMAGFSNTASGGGNQASYEHRLSEVEKKLQTLMDEMKALRKERRRVKPDLDNKLP